MTEHDLDIKTCANSLLNAGTCCEDGCTEPATHALLVHDTLVEHTRCQGHVTGGQAVSIKPLSWAEEWKP